MLKRKISKAIYDSLADGLKELYKPSGADFILDVEADDNVAPIKESLERARAELAEYKQKHGEANSKAQQLQARVDELEHDVQTAGKSEIEKLQLKHEKEIKKLTEEKDGKINEVTGYLRSDMLGRTSQELAKKLFKSAPEVMAESVIKGRLDLEFKDGKATVVAKAADGTPMTLDLLEKEILADKRYSDILIGSKASGGGATQPSGGQNPGGGATNLTEQHRQQAASLGLPAAQTPYDPSTVSVL